MRTTPVAGVVAITAQRYEIALVVVVRIAIDVMDFCGLNVAPLGTAVAAQSASLFQYNPANGAPRSVVPALRRRTPRLLSRLLQNLHTKFSIWFAEITVPRRVASQLRANRILTWS